MRWFALLLVLSLVHGATAKRECSVSEFVSVAYSNHNTKERHDRLVEWLDDSGQVCTKEQLALIYRNLAQVVGIADSIKLRTMIERLYERAK